ncbi:hypothetical protein KM043_011814 [Ampulex compressa]|nr:hypothetical protein KM043_011814 [Ampulex compressa]
MLTVMCPNCRHRFPAPGCCEPESMKKDASVVHPTACYYGSLLVPRGYTSGGSCFINAPTIVHGPAIIHSGGAQPGLANVILTQEALERSLSTANDKPMDVSTAKLPVDPRLESMKSQSEPLRMSYPAECHITTTCDLTGGSVTITTPSIQSGGCVIQSTDSGILVQAPHVEIRPKLSGGGCFVQKRLSTEDHEAVSPLLESAEPILGERKYANDPIDPCCGIAKNHQQMLLVPPGGCQELPGIRRSTVPKDEPMEIGRVRHGTREEGSTLGSFEGSAVEEPSKWQTRKSGGCCCGNVQNLCQAHGRSGGLVDNRESLIMDPGAGVQIQVNATVQLPASLGQCTVNITATTENSPGSIASSGASSRSRNNFNGGGLVQTENDGGQGVSVQAANSPGNPGGYNERRDGTPTTPVSWLMPCPWGFDTYLMDKDLARLCEVKRLLQACGWYHEGLSWQQSENLLKDTPVGRWLMRDSSDSRYTFAVSVQTARGPTSVRVHYFLGRFRLDAEPSLALAMPVFDCPIKMLEHYVEDTKSMDEHRKEVWVDYSGQIYSQIYLTKPLVKEVRPLSHLARLAVNRSKISTEHLPPIIKNYLAEYPYTL